MAASNDGRDGPANATVANDHDNVDWGDNSGGTADAQFGAGQDSFDQDEHGFGDGNTGGGGNDACFSCG